MFAQIMVACERRHSKLKIFDMVIFNFRKVISRQSKVQISFFPRTMFAKTDLWGFMPKFFTIRFLSPHFGHKCFDKPPCCKIIQSSYQFKIFETLGGVLGFMWGGMFVSSSSSSSSSSCSCSPQVESKVPNGLR